MPIFKSSVAIKNFRFSGLLQGVSDRFSARFVRGLVGGVLVLFIAFAATQMVQYTYAGRDMLIYTMVAEGIFEHGLLPYTYVFDHKPLLLYLFYAPFAFIDGDWSSYVLLALVALATMTWIARSFFIGSRWPVPIVFLAMAASTTENVELSGNSELVYVPLQLLAVGLLLTSAGRPVRFWGAAAATVVAVNCNYFAAVPLLPALLYAIWTRSGAVWAFLRDCVGYALVCLAVMTLILLGAAAAGMDVVTYFRLQYAFLTGYSIVSSALSPIFLARILPFLIISALPLVPALRPVGSDRVRVIALEGLVLGTLAALVLSGKYFSHYIFALAAPAVIILMIVLPRSQNWARVGQIACLGILALYYTADIARKAISGAWIWQHPPAYAELHETIAGAPVMSMRVSVAPLFFGDGVPYQPVVWREHMAILYGLEDQDARYADLIASGPPFVLTSSAWCKRDGLDWQACALLEENYRRIDEQRHKPEVLAPGYTLWRRSDAQLPTAADNM